jgi:hypothetical protein
MQTEHLKAILTAAGAREADEGWNEAPEGRTITLYAAHDGATLTIPRAVAIRVLGEMVHARTQKGETYIVMQADLFAGSVDGSANAGRKAGFI